MHFQHYILYTQKQNTIFTDSLTRAERTAATLEAQLNSLEQKLDNFLAEHDKEEEGGWREKEPDSVAPTDSKDGIEKVGNS